MGWDRLSRRRFVGAGALVAGSAVLGAPSSTFAAPVVRHREAGQAQDVVEVTFHHIWGTPPGTAGGDKKSRAEEVIDLFNAKNTGVKVVSRTDSGSYYDVLLKTQAELAAGNGPALVSTPWANINWAAEGLGLVPLDDVAGDDLGAVLGNLREDVIPLVQIDGKTMGMPYAFSNPVIYYNQEMLDEAGVDPAELLSDWDVLLNELGPKVKEATGGPVLGLTDGQWAAQGIAQSNGGFIMNDENVFVMDSPETTGAMAKIAELDAAGILNRSTRKEETMSFVGGSLPCYYASIASLSGLRDQVQFTMGVSTFPTFGEKERLMSSGGSFIGMYAREAEQQQAAWEFLKFAASEEGYTPWAQMGYLNATTFDMPMLEGQEAAYTQLEEGVTRETPWPTERGGELAAIWATMVSRIWQNDISAEEGCAEVAAELNGMIGNS